MAYRAVVFDLFGTLVGNFSVQEYDRVLMRMADALSTPYPEFRFLIAPLLVVDTPCTPRYTRRPRAHQRSRPSRLPIVLLLD
jgi:hypothetical protein